MKSIKKTIAKMVIVGCTVMSTLLNTRILYAENVDNQGEYHMQMYDNEQGIVVDVIVPKTDVIESAASAIVNDMPSTSIIIGEDEQKKVSKEYPYSAVMFLGIRYSDGTTMPGTGVLIGPDILFTAGHIFYSENHGKAVEVRTYPSMNEEGETFPKNLNDIPGEWCYPKYWFSGRVSLTDTNDYNNQNDWAVAKLAKRYGDTYGYWGYKADAYDTTNVNVVGYPSSSPAKRFFPYLSSGVVVHETNYQDSSPSVIEYLADTETGNSGSPVFCYYNGSPTAIATHVIGYEDPISPVRFNIGRIIDSTIVYCIQYCNAN